MINRASSWKAPRSAKKEKQFEEHDDMELLQLQLILVGESVLPEKVLAQLFTVDSVRSGSAGTF